MTDFIELLNELEKRFGKDWQDAEIDVESYPFWIGFLCNSRPSISDAIIYNNHGIIYINGRWAEPKKEEVPEPGSLCFFWDDCKNEGRFDTFDFYYKGSTWPYSSKNMEDWYNCQQVKAEHVEIIKSYLEL